MKVPFNVGVIGAGPAGLCAAKHLLEDECFSVTVFDQQTGLGGLWRYTERTGVDDNGERIYSSLYDNTRTNIPKSCMGFPDFEIPPCEENSYIHHTKVLKYLEKYAEKFKLKQCIKFSKKVLKVSQIKGRENYWIIQTVDLISNSIESFIFDAIIVCNGSCSLPKMPNYPGLATFPGPIVHSHDYRNNNIFKDLDVLVIGSGPSAVDIAVDISMAAKNVIVSHRTSQLTFQKESPKNLKEHVGNVSSIKSNEINFENGDKFRVEAIALCTGYDLDISFLDPSCGVKLHNRRITPLYKHFISVRNPTLSLLGILNLFIPFPYFHQQVKALLKLWKGSIKLPNVEEMLAAEESDFKRRLGLGYPEHYAHYMHLENLQWEYLDGLADWAQIPRLLPSVSGTYIDAIERRKVYPVSYKNVHYQINNGGHSFTSKL